MTDIVSTGSLASDGRVGTEGLDQRMIERLGVLLPSLAIGDRIGGGAGGVVVEATSRDTGELVAVKIATTSERRSLLAREASVLSSVRHPHLVAGHHAVDDGVVAALVMERVAGTPLSSMLTGRALPVLRAIEVAVATGRALAAVHDAGHLHGDVKPENVLVCSTRRHRLIDLGLTRPWPSTVDGPLLATTEYLAPEAFERPAVLDRGTDVYALATLTYEMLSGQLPITIADRDARSRRTMRQPVPLGLVCPWLPLPVQTAVDSGLHTDPSRRLGTASEFIALLEAAT